MAAKLLQRSLLLLWVLALGIGLYFVGLRYNSSAYDPVAGALVTAAMFLPGTAILIALALSSRFSPGHARGLSAFLACVTAVVGFYLMKEPDITTAVLLLVVILLFNVGAVILASKSRNFAFAKSS